jgi:hypothetical protein
VTVVLCIGLLEIGLRSIGRSPSNTSEGIGEAYKDFYRLKKNIEKGIRWPSYSYTIYTNSFGFRDRAVGSRDLDGKPLYVFLGASEVFGNGVEYEKTFVGVFSQQAASKGIEVLNMAIGGHYFLDQEILLKDFISETGKTPAVVFHCVNDLHIPKFDRRNESIVVKNGHLLDEQGWRMAYVRLLVGDVSAAYCFFRNAARSLQAKWTSYQAMDKSPEFIQIYSRENRMHKPETVAQFENYLMEFEGFCREKGITPVYVYIPLSDSFRLDDLLRGLGKDPREFDTSYYEKLMESYCAKRGVKLVNLRPALKSLFDQGKSLRFELDPHFNEPANRVIGDYLAESVLGVRVTGGKAKDS